MGNQMGSLKKALLGCVILMMVFAAFVAGYRWAYSRIPIKKMSDSTTRLFPNDVFKYYLGDAEMLPGGAGGFYAPTGDDPLMLFVFDDPMEINSLRISFKQPLAADTVIEVYSTQENALDKIKSLKYELSPMLPADSDDFITDLTAGRCGALRVDINGNAIIDFIEVSDQSLQNVYPWAHGASIVLLACILASVFALAWLIIRCLSIFEAAFLSDGASTQQLWKNVFILAVLFLGIVLRFMVMAFGYNYDFESYCIVGNIAGHFRNVYAETSRYNYGPIFFILQGTLYRISLIAGDKWESLYRILIVSMLTLTDLGITVFIAHRYSMKAALLFFLNPISVCITGQHNQFDNMAILFGLLTIPYFNDDPEWNRRDIGFVLFFTLSLITKHILFLVPVILLLSKELSLKKKALYAFVPPALFLLSFIPFIIGNSAAFSGVMNNVFLYRSHDNSPLFHALYEYLGLPGNKSFFVFITCMLIVSFLSRKQGYDAALLLYLISLVCFSSAIANQYLAIPMVALFLLYSGGWKYVYIATLFSYLLSNYEALGMRIPLPEGFCTLAYNWITTNAYSIAAWLLLIILIYIAVMGKKKKSVFDPSIALLAGRQG